MNIQHYLNERVEGQINYFESKSALNKSYYHRFKVSQMVAAALLPFASVFISEYESVKYLVAFLGTIVTILEGVLAIGKYHEKWINYRATGEALRQEKFIYLMQAGTYTGLEAATTFVNRVEMILGKENLGWQQMIVTEPPKPENNHNGNGQVNGTAFGENGAGKAKETPPVQGSENVETNEDSSAAIVAEENEETEVLNDPLLGVPHDEENDTEMAGMEEENIEVGLNDKPVGK